MKQNTTPLPLSIKYALIIYFLTIMISAVSVGINIYFAPPEQSRLFLITAALIIIVFLLFIGHQVYKAKKWSRIFLAILVIYGSFLHLTEPGAPHHPAVAYLQWVLYALSILYTIMLFLPQSNQWFKTFNKWNKTPLINSVLKGNK